MEKAMLPILFIFSVIFVCGCTQAPDNNQTQAQYWCGDGSCLPGSYNGYTEDCTSCSQDCGVCPPAQISRFGVSAISCNSVLSQLKLTLSNIYNETVNVQNVRVNLIKDGVSTTKTQNPNKMMAPSESLSFIFPTVCSIDYFQIQTTYIDAKGTHTEYGINYTIPGGRAEFTLQESCLNGGGTLATTLCCNSVGNLPNTCLIGACGCAPGNSHNVTTCTCPQYTCWNGTTCV